MALSSTFSISIISVRLTEICVCARCLIKCWSFKIVVLQYGQIRSANVGVVRAVKTAKRDLEP